METRNKMTRKDNIYKDMLTKMLSKNSIKMFMLIILTCTFVLVTCSFDAYAASRNEYTLTMSNGEKYIIIANDSGDGKYTIVNTPYNELTNHFFGEALSGTSLYNILANDYEDVYNLNVPNQGRPKLTEARQYRGQDILNMFELFVRGQKGETGKYIYTEIIDGNNDNAVIISGDNNTFAYGSNGSGLTRKTYKEIIYDNAQNTSNKSPYYVNGTKKNSDNIYYANHKLSEYYTDLEIIKAYENLSSPESVSWITKKETTESIASVGDYSLLLDTTTDENNIYAKVMNKTDNSELASFLIAQKVGDSTKYDELTYANDSSLNLRLFSDVTSFRVEATTNGHSYDTSKLLYYNQNASSPSKQTIDMYYDESAKKISVTEGNGFVAVRDGLSNSVKIYYIGTEDENYKLHLIGSLSLLNIKDMLNTGAITAVSGEWLINNTGNIIKIYKDSETNIDENAIYLNLSKMFACYNDVSAAYDIVIPTVRGIDGEYYSKIESEEGRLLTLITSRGSISKKYDDPAECILIFNDDFNNGSKEMYARVLRMKDSITTFGTNTDNDKLKAKEYESNSDDPDNLPPDLPLKEIMLTPAVKELVSSFVETESTAVNGTYNNTLEDKTEISIEFIGTLIGYGKTILIVLIFIGIVMAGFRHMTEGAISGEERAKTIVRFKHLAAGIIVFIIISLIMVLIITYVDKGVAFFDEYTEDFGVGIFESEDKIARQSLLLDIIEVMIRVVNAIMAGLIEFSAKSLSGSSAGINYIALIYDCYDDSGQVSAMSPFSENGVEWTRCLSGYNVLVSIAMLIMLFVVIKTAAEYIIFSGNQKKILEIKETWYRMFWAIILILIVPYMTQALIYLFNYMTAAVPVNVADAKYDLELEFAGVLGAIAENLFLTVKFNLYMAFLIRHVMLDLLIISAPIVIAAWAVSDKFRSFHIWIGELITNIAMQFCYAVGFLVIILLSFEGENPIYGLLLVSIAMGLSKFIKESLQGYFQEWGGIDEEGAASNIVARVFGWGRKAKTISTAIGGALEKAGDQIDPEQTTKLGNGMHNAGRLMQFKVSGIHIKPTRLKNLQKAAGKLDEEAKQDEKDAEEEYEAQLEVLPEDEKIAAEEYKIAALQDDDDFVKKEGGIYDAINNYVDARKEHERTHENKNRMDRISGEAEKNRLGGKFREAAKQKLEESYGVEGVNLEPDEDVRQRMEDEQQKKQSEEIINRIQQDGSAYPLKEAYVDSFTNMVADARLLSDSASKMQKLDGAMEELKALATSDAIFTASENKQIVESMAGLIAGEVAEICKEKGINIEINLVADKYASDIKGVYKEMSQHAVSITNANNKPENLKYFGEEDKALGNIATEIKRKELERKTSRHKNGN